MKASLGVIILASLCVGVTGCSMPLVGIDPRLAPAQRDQSQRDMPRPPLRGDLRRCAACARRCN